jgi:GGDEF domain-containing protein
MADPIVQQMLEEDRSGAADIRATTDAGAPEQPQPSFPGPTSAPRPTQTVGQDVDPIVQQMKTEQDQVERTQAQLLDFRAKNDVTDAGTRADVLRYSAASGLEPAFVEKNLDQVKKRVDQAGVDWRQVQYQHPELAQWMVENPAATPLVKDDVANLGTLHWALVAPYYAVFGGLQEQRLIAKQFAEAQGSGSAERRAEIAQLEAEYGNRDYGANNFLTRGYIGAYKMLPYLAGDIAARTGGGYLGAMLGGGAGAGEGAAAGGAATAPVGGEGAAVGAPTGAIAGGTTGAAVGQFVASGVYNYYENLGPMYWRLKQLRAANGQALDDDTARAFAQGGAALTGGLMSGFMGKFAAKLPGVSGLLGDVGERAVGRALQDATLTQTMKRGGVEFGKSWLTGATMMAAQSGLSAATEESAKAYSDQPFDVQWANVGRSAGEGFKSGLEDMWLISALGPGREMLREIGRARSSAEAAAQLEAMTDSAKASKLLERSPEQFRKAVEAMKAKDGAVKNVYVPAEEWVSYWQKQKLDPARVAAEVMGDDGKGLADAIANNGDLAIPVEKYLSKLAKSDHAVELAQSAKLRPEDATPKQHAAEQKALKQRMDKAAAARKPELDDGAKEVFTFIRDQAVAAGIDKKEADANAKIVSEYSRTLALRLNTSAQDAAWRGGLGSLRVLGPKGEQVATAARERFKRFLGPIASEQLRARLASLSDEQAAKEHYLDPFTGARDAKAFDQLYEPEHGGKLPEGKKVGVLTLPAVKGINDNPDVGGHYVANDVLREVARPLVDTHPEAARGGTNFRFLVDAGEEREQLAAAITKVKAGLDPNLDVVGATGNDSAAAFANLKTEQDRRRALPPEHVEHLPARGVLRPGLDLTSLKLSKEMAKGSVPQELVAKVTDRTEREHFEAAYLDRIYRTVEGERQPVNTGLLSAEGFRATPARAHTLMIDLRGLGALPKDMGDDLLITFARAMTDLGGHTLDAAHLSGDEFAAKHDDRAVLEQFAERLRGFLKGKSITAQGPNGEELVADVLFRHGTGADVDAADRDLNRKRRAEEAAQGEPRGDRPADGPEQAARDSGQRESDLEFGNEESPFRNARGQAWPAAEVELSQEALAHQEDAALRAGEDEARAFIDRMRLPGKKTQAQAWLEYCLGDREKRPAAPDSLKQLLADRYGIVDPEGHSFNEQGRNLERGVGGKKKFNEEPYELRKYRLERLGYYPRVKQLPLVHIEGATVTLNAPDGGGPERGSLQMRITPEGKPVDFSLQVLNGDRSTFAHETAHFLSWSLHSIADSNLATDALKADYDTLLNFAGYKSAAEREQLNAEHGQLRRVTEPSAEQTGRLKEINAKEERISHAWEQYLAEGKAPTRRLGGVFTRFKDWLVGLYRGIDGVKAQYRVNYGQELGLSDEVRGVFDRLLAGDRALDEARGATATDTRIPGLAQHMTPAELDRMKQLRDDARTEADLETQGTAADLLAKQVAEFRGKARAESAAELNQQPVYRAMRFFQYGELLNGQGEPVQNELLVDKNGQPLKVDRASFVKEFGAETARKMPKGMLVRADGVPLEEIPPLLGFGSGEQLVKALREATPLDRELEARTQAKVDAEFTPAQRHLADFALKAANNDFEAEMKLLELRAMAKVVNPAAERRVRTVSLDRLKRTAQERISDTTVDALDPKSYANAERANSLRAARLWGEGKHGEAFERREAALFNQVLLRAARDAQDELAASHDKLAATNEKVRADLGKADPLYRDVHDAILEAVGVGEASPQSADFDAMLRRAEDDGHQVAFDVDQVKQLLEQPRSWESLTVDEARNVADAITNIRHIAKQVLGVDLAGRKFGRDQLLLSLAERAADVRRPILTETEDRAALPAVKKIGNLRRSASSIFQDAETWAHKLDGGPEGPAHDLLVKSRRQARDVEVELTKGVLEKVRTAWAKVPKEFAKLRNQQEDLADLLPPTSVGFAPLYTRSFLWMLFLNQGNEGNRQRVRDGNGWSDENVQKALARLTPEECDFLQSVLDTTNSLWPAVSAAHEKRTGLPLGKVEATPIVVNGAEYAGGYFPLKYDSRKAVQGQVQEINTIKDLFPSNRPPLTTKSHTKTRLDQVQAPVDLSWSVVPAHLANVIHDLAYGDWVRQVGNVMMRPAWPHPVCRASTTRCEPTWGRRWRRRCSRGCATWPAPEPTPPRGIRTTSCVSSGARRSGASRSTPRASTSHPWPGTPSIRGPRWSTPTACTPPGSRCRT